MYLNEYEVERLVAMRLEERRVVAARERLARAARAASPVVPGALARIIGWSSGAARDCSPVPAKGHGARA